MSDSEVSGDYNISNFRPQVEVGGWRVNGIRVHEPGSVTFNTERSCVNCTNEIRCWSNNIHRVITEQPPLFRLRSSWNASNYPIYLKRVFGGLCGAFTHINDDVNRSLQAAERSKLNKQEPQEWEE
jgi:hypothetical protein